MIGPNNSFPNFEDPNRLDEEKFKAMSANRISPYPQQKSS